MRVLLINPPSQNVLRVTGIFFPPLGILYIAAATRDRGYRVEVRDLSVDPRRIDFDAFDVVGIHSDTTRYLKAIALARRAKASGARVVMGGPHPWYKAEEIIETGLVDVIVKGEGEKTFPDLLDSWKQGTDPFSIPGLILSNPNGRRDTGAPERILDVDALSFPARDLVDLSLYSHAHLGYRRLTSIHTSRGCPYGCRFCSSTHFDGATWRARSAENVLAELEHVVRDLGYGAVAFMDDNFAGSPERIHRICDGILKKDLDVHWWCFCRVDNIVRHPEMIGHMAEAGARNIFIGVESPNAKQLKRFHKGIEPNQARKAVRILKKNKIEIMASFILGAPEETRADIRATVRFAKELDTETAQFTILTPFPGTALYEQLEDRITEKDWGKFDGIHSVFQHPRIPRIELQLWHIWANISFYFRHLRSISGFFRFLIYRRKNRA